VVQTALDNQNTAVTEKKSGILFSRVCAFFNVLKHSGYYTYHQF